MLYYSIIIITTIITLYFTYRGKSIETGTLWFVICFFFGYRTFEVFPQFSIHPLDLIVVALFIKAILINEPSSTAYPKWLLSLIPFSLLALIIGFIRSSSPALVMMEFKNFSFIFLLFFFLRKISLSQSTLNKLGMASIGVISAISLFGILEYYAPTLRELLPGFYNLDRPAFKVKTDGFHRVSFTFWGSASAGHIITAFLPFVFLIRLPKEKWYKSYLIVIGSSVLLNLWAIYLTANRLDWLAVIIMLSLFLFLYPLKQARWKLLAVPAIVLFAIIARSIPTFWTRFESAFMAFTSSDRGLDALGPSIFERQSRIIYAIDLAKNHPFGVGWTGSGWVHSDFLQIIANMGWLPGFIFLLAFSYSGIMALRLILSKKLNMDEQRTLLVLLMSFSTVGLMFTLNINYVLSQLGIPFFFLWALLYNYYNKLKNGI